MRTLVVFNILLPIVVVASAAEPTPWLPISKTDLIAATFDELNATPTVKSMVEVLKERRSRPGLDSDGQARIDAMLKEIAALAGDSVLIAATEKPPLSVTFAAQGERVHTIRVFVPVVSYRDKRNADQVFTNLSNLFARIYPTWRGARNWPKDSLGKSWNAHPWLTKQPLRDPNDLIPRTTIDGVTSATFGVPPDLVVYTITTRSKCIPDAHKVDPFRRAIC